MNYHEEIDAWVARWKVENDREIEASKAWRAKCRPAGVADYQAWLEGYLENGGTVTHDYCYSLGVAVEKYWLVAVEDLTITELYRADQLSIIVPVGIECGVESIGHNSVYFMDGFQVAGGFVPGFSDIESGEDL